MEKIHLKQIIYDKLNYPDDQQNNPSLWLSLSISVFSYSYKFQEKLFLI